jgi:hypothetical protein
MILSEVSWQQRSRSRACNMMHDGCDADPRIQVKPKRPQKTRNTSNNALRLFFWQPQTTEETKPTRNTLSVANTSSWHPEPASCWGPYADASTSNESYQHAPSLCRSTIYSGERVMILLCGLYNCHQSIWLFDFVEVTTLSSGPLVTRLVVILNLAVVRCHILEPSSVGGERRCIVYPRPHVLPTVFAMFLCVRSHFVVMMTPLIIKPLMYTYRFPSQVLTWSAMCIGLAFSHHSAHNSDGSRYISEDSVGLKTSDSLTILRSHFLKQNHNPCHNTSV